MESSQLIMFGGAWKGPHAEQNVLEAVSLGYRSFDTANVYPASYNETAMGVALERAIAIGLLKRDDLFIQTKFTPGISESYCKDGPWDPATCMFDKTADLSAQVKQSAETSLAHLRISKLDSLILHEMRVPWNELLIIWKSMEEIYMEGKTASIGLSHAHDPQTLRRFLAVAQIKPSFIQNPIFAYNNWDRDIRLICQEYGIEFQSYSLNHQENDFVYQSEEVLTIAKRLNRTPQQVIVAFTKRLGLIPLVGPQDTIKMAHAITAARYIPDLLTDEEVHSIEYLSSYSQTPMTIAKELKMTVSNELSSGVYIAWRTPDHSDLRVNLGMHAAPELVAPGEKTVIFTHHRHGFYIWDAAEGDRAPLYREGDDRRWVRRVTADGTKGKEFKVIVNQSFEVVVVNMAPESAEVSIGGTKRTVMGGGGTMRLDLSDGDIASIKQWSDEAVEIAVRRSDGDPQLLALHPAETARGAVDAEL